MLPVKLTGLNRLENRSNKDNFRFKMFKVTPLKLKNTTKTLTHPNPSSDLNVENYFVRLPRCQLLCVHQYEEHAKYMSAPSASHC